MLIDHVLAGAAASWPATATWPAIRAAVFTAAGLVMMVVGARRVYARRRWERADEQRLLQGETSGADREPAPLKGGGMLAWGVVLFLFGLAHGLDMIARLIGPGLV
ncbi:hypothetical protein A5630_18810 [Mycolicibacterium mucogenicum]|uniref:Uncharacterized protein n=1 Tax=Mycolicibacterium mucogenicum TaxID=56689 RepID=A0A1A3H7F8_MYCMU|nr:hypothetical protein [Mycolicibacterium mucogenicum]OBJ43546.1 hypothetical protein A5630_18810 [Mycolicibacterium mucogenicum]